MLKRIPAKDPALFVYDCFSDERFGGNVGGLVMGAGELSPGTMQNIAREINAPVTGFVTEQSGREVSIRFFMPGAEIAMCGHVTVGLFTHLCNVDGADEGRFVMKAQAGDVEVEVNRDDAGNPQVMMKVVLPDIMPAELNIDELAGALGLPASDVGHLSPVEIADAGLCHMFVRLDSLKTVQNLAPDFKKLTEISKSSGVHTIACFTMETENAKNTLHVRDFCPAVGVDEVPASGTTNGALAGYLVRHGLVGEGAQTVLAEQGAELGRPSLIRCDIEASGNQLTSVKVGGQAVLSLMGSVAGVA